MKHMIAILTWLGLSAGMLHAHYFDVAIVVPPGDGQAAMQAFLLASAERDGHPDETSDGHLGGLDSHVTIVENGDHADAQAIRPDSAAPHIIVAISTQVPDGLRYPDAWTFRVTRVSDRAAREYLNAGVLPFSVRFQQSTGGWRGWPASTAWSLATWPWESTGTPAAVNFAFSMSVMVQCP